MSYTSLYKITPKGYIREVAEFHNSHRSAALVWSNLWKRYCEDEINKYEQVNGWSPHNPANEEHWKLVWNLWRRDDVPLPVSAVLLSTFDYVYLERDHFQRFYDDVLKYAGWFAAGTLIEQAQAILALSKQKIIGVCWNQTSVVSMWEKRKISEYEAWSLYRELDECRPAPGA